MPNPTGGLIGWRRTLLFPIAIMGGAVLVAVLIFYYPQLKGLVIKTTPAPTPKIEVIATGSGQLPPDLPKDIILDKNASILRGSYTRPFVFPQGGGTIYQVQSTLAFITNKNTADIFSLYNSYLKNGKWEGITPLDENGIKRLTASKGQDKITITISKNFLTDQTTVDIFNLHIGTWSSINKSPSPSPTPTLSK